MLFEDENNPVHKSCAGIKNLSPDFASLRKPNFPLGLQKQKYLDGGFLFLCTELFIGVLDKSEESRG